jgi:hypothetical protein
MGQSVQTIVYTVFWDCSLMILEINGCQRPSCVQLASVVISKPPRLKVIGDRPTTYQTVCNTVIHGLLPISQGVVVLRIVAGDHVGDAGK